MPAIPLPLELEKEAPPVIEDPPTPAVEELPKTGTPVPVPVPVMPLPPETPSLTPEKPVPMPELGAQSVPPPAFPESPVPLPPPVAGDVGGVDPLPPPAPFPATEVGRDKAPTGTSERVEAPAPADVGVTPVVPVPTPDRTTNEPKDRAAGGEENEILRPIPVTPPAEPARSPSPNIRPATPVTPAIVASANDRGPRPKVESFNEMEYVVRSGDTYATISKAEYRSESYAKALRAYNRYDSLVSNVGADPSGALKPGQVVSVPDLYILEKRYGHLVPNLKPLPATKGTSEAAPVATAGNPVIYRVAPGGERMRDIARKTLGNAERWNEIYNLNRQHRPAFVIPGGTQLRLPPDAKAPGF